MGSPVDPGRRALTCCFPSAGGEVSQENLLLHGPFARKPKRIRTAFSPSQLLRLERAFEKNHYVVGAERKQLAGSLSLSETQVGRGAVRGGGGGRGALQCEAAPATAKEVREMGGREGPFSPKTEAARETAAGCPRVEVAASVPPSHGALFPFPVAAVILCSTQP